MNKKNLETVMKKEYQKGTAKYNKLWDALQLLFRLGLISVSEMENIKTINHDLSKLHN